MKSANTLFVAAAVAGICTAQPAYAQKSQAIPPIYLLGEDDDADLLGCGTSYSTVLDAAGDALGAAGVSLGTETQALEQRALTMYINLNISPIVYDDGEDTGSCYGSVNLRLSSYDIIVEPVTRTNRFATINFCMDGFTFTLSRSSLRSAVNDEVQQKIAGCLQEWLASAE